MGIQHAMEAGISYLAFDEPAVIWFASVMVLTVG